MSVLVVFGFPGSGKTYVGKILKKYFDYYFYDGDVEMPKNMKKVILAGAPVTNEMRNKFFNTLLKKIKLLKVKYPKLAIGQTYIKEKYRKRLIKEVPETKFLLVKTNTNIRESRLVSRKEFPLAIEYSRKMCLNFDQPLIRNDVINNDKDGNESVIRQLESLL